jgi:terminase large subunit-like protein
MTRKQTNDTRGTYDGRSGTPKLPRTLHTVECLPSQRRFYESKAQFKGFSGPVGSGKTYALCYEALLAACRNPGCLGLIGGPTYAHLYDVTIPMLEEILTEQDIPFKLWGARPRLYLKRQKVLIVFRTLESPSHLRGLNLAWFGIDELTYCRQNAWQVLCQRIRHPQARQLEGFAVWTPKGFDWVYQHFISAKRKLADYEAIIASPMENMAVLGPHPEYYERLKRQYDEQLYRQEALGEYLNIYAGACYHAFEEQRCAGKPTQFDPSLGGLAWALDFNIDPMASLICQVKGSRRVDVLNEITLSVGNAEQMCAAFVRMAQPYLQAWRAARGGYPLPVKLYGDASGSTRSLVGKTVYAIIEQYFRDIARDFKLEMNPNVSNPPVIDRVASVNAMLWNARGEVGCFVDPGCKELITDFCETSWCQGNQHEIDKKRDRKRTHWSDALGYLLYKDFRPDAFRRQISPADGRPYDAA